MPTPRSTFTVQDGVSLKEHVDCRLAALQEYVEARLCDMNKFIIESFASRDKALVVAWDSLKAKMIDENHVRTQLRENAQDLVTKTEYRGDIKRLTDEVQQLREYRASMEGKASQTSVTIAYLIAAPGLIIGLISLAKLLAGS